MFKTNSTPLSLRLVLVLPFVLQIFTAVGLVGYLSFRTGQKAVEDLADRLMTEIGNRVERRIETHLSIPPFINHSNAEAFRLNIIDIKNTELLERHFWKQLQIYDSVTYIYLGNAEGGVIGAGLSSNSTSVIGITEGFVSGDYYEYSVDSQGRRQELLKSSTYDSRERPWFQIAKQANKPVWSDIYLFFSVQTLGITATKPIYDDRGSFQGVLGVDFHLSSISDFLQQIEIGRSGEVFIMERSGDLIASSTPVKLFELDPDSESNRIKAEMSDDITIQKTAIYLNNFFGSIKKINQHQKLKFELNQQQHFLQVFPFEDAYGLDWLIVIVVPEADFMGEIYANTQRTIILCLVSLIMAVAIGTILARWVTEPLLKLNAAAKEIANGKLDNTVELYRPDEVGQLAVSFDRMARQLQESFGDLAKANIEITTLNAAYERFVPDQFLSFLEKDSIVDVELGDRVEREMTVLFSDIRDFTTISEQMTPAENFAFINEYLGYMEPQIQKYGGFIDKYIGDAIMALFPGSADDAVQGAIAMLEQLKTYNLYRQEKNLIPLRIGIGLHTGKLILGTVGGFGRMDGTVIGDAVNLSSRVEGLTKTYGVSLLITHQTVARLNNPLEYDLRFIEQVKAKGKAKAVGLFEVFSADPPKLRAAKVATKEQFERAVMFYHWGSVPEAGRLFQECLEYDDGDRPAQIYLDRCQS